MAQSEVQICNLALVKIGVSRLIEALTEQTNEARLCALMYPVVRDEILAGFAWSFARKHLVLTPLADYTPPSGWSYGCLLPTDCLKARKLWYGDEQELPAQSLPFTLAGNVLLTNEEAPELVYTYQVTDPTLFPPLFTNALSWGLAVQLATPLSARAELATLAAQTAPAALLQAQAADLQQRHDAIKESPTITARS